VTIYCIDSPNYAPGHVWNNVKAKYRRPLNSLILAGGVVDSVINDANEFLNMEEWYADAGIPHRRGYLLYGPPGTGKTSTVYAVAGELGLEIYALSLASSFIDDSFLQRAVSSVPKHSLLLIEDIDCAFPSRDGSDDWGEQRTPGARAPPQSRVTLSGLLNVIDGVNSEDGRLFFATTNHIDQLDPALLRPGRIDKKVQYKLATMGQAMALYKRFFPESRFANVTEGACAETADRDTAISNDNEKSFYSNGQSRLSALARQFAESVPEDEFSTAELQGYLLMCKMSPSAAVSGIDKWIEHERKGRREREEREKHRKQKARESRLETETAVVVTDLLVPVQQHKTMTQEDDAVEPTTQSILPSGPDINLDISPQTVSSATALLDDDPDPSKFLHGNRVRMMDL
jgi:chaperone BCS1